MTNVKSILMAGVAVIGLTAPVAAQSVSADSATSLGADAGMSSGGMTANADTMAQADMSMTNTSDGEDTLNTSGDVALDADAELTTDLAQDDAVTTPTTSTDLSGNAEAVANAGTRVGALIGIEVASSAGETIGEIDDVVDINGETMAIVGVGGFMGLGEHDVALPVTELMYEGNTVTAMGYTREQLKSMAEFNAEAASSLSAEETVELGSS